MSAPDLEGIGHSVRRKEDFRLLTGKGCFSDDLNLPGQVYAVMVRSPHAHARLAGIDSSRAALAPGVLAILTGEDARADGLASIPHAPRLRHPPDVALLNRDGSPHYVSAHLPLPVDKARFAGEVVAVVIAESTLIAKDAAEQLRIDYEPLTAVTDTAMAVRLDAPLVWEERRSNICIDADEGDSASTATAFARAAHVSALETWVQRVAGVPMEPRAAIGAYDAIADCFTLYAGGGGVVRPKNQLAAILGISESKVRVVAQDIGGNFGTRNPFYPEFALVVWAARRLGRPVKWTAERHESFLGDCQGRDLVVQAELALDEHGNFLAMRGSNISNIGAHCVSFTPLAKGVQMMSGPYDIPAARFRGRAVVSNTPSTNPYRSAGRPEAIFVMERLIDMAAREHGFDRVELRRRNLVPQAAMPYANPLGVTYDSGNYHESMDSALSLSDWSGFAARRIESKGRGRLRGIGIANYVEVTSGAPRERAEVSVRPEGKIDVVIGTLSSGQGHETSFAQLVTEWLGVPSADVNLIQGDTQFVKVGGGSHSGRSMRLAGIVIGNATEEIRTKGARGAAFMLEAAASDIDFQAGRFVVKGTDRSVGIYEVAAAASGRKDLPEELRGSLAAESEVDIPYGACPYGCQVCEVEVDPETGVVEIAAYVAVDDVGTAINPMIVHGQTHGGAAQGIGQALFEHCHYEAQTGQLLSASFMDYCLPRADHLPSFTSSLMQIPSTTNPLGVRAGGEGGTTPALAVVINAIVDALADLGVRHIDMPATPERVWRAIGLARRRV